MMNPETGFGYDKPESTQDAGREDDLTHYMQAVSRLRAENEHLTALLSGACSCRQNATTYEWEHVCGYHTDLRARLDAIEAENAALQQRVADLEQAQEIRVESIRALTRERDELARRETPRLWKCIDCKAEWSIERRFECSYCPECKGGNCVPAPLIEWDYKKRAEAAEAELETLRAKAALADEAESLIERIDAYPEDWSSLFIEAVQEWRDAYDALTTEASPAVVEEG